MGVDDHKAYAPAAAAVRIFIITASDSRTPETNQGGRLVRQLAERAGFAVTGESLLPDERDAIQGAVSRIVDEGAADAILLTGGTGIASRDTTVEAVAGLLHKRIDGYGELFRMLSFAEIGPAAMLSRAVGGSVGRVAVFLMPGSPAGVRLAMERLILPELTHVVGELSRKDKHGQEPHGDPHGDHGHGHSHH
jgi:molybdenum cofactor biosynthesis protein B